MIGAALGAVQGLAGIATGIIGSAERKRDRREAQAMYDRRMADFANIDTSNPYAGLQNTYEDLTINQQGLANTMDAMQGAAGGSGIAALAQAMAQQQSMNAQQAGASIGRQEAQNQAAAAGMAGQLQQMEARGEMLSRNMEMQKTQQQFNIAREDVLREDAEKQAATQAIIGGFGKLAGGLAGTQLGQDTLSFVGLQDAK
jgi:hypothetical protein